MKRRNNGNPAGTVKIPLPQKIRYQFDLSFCLRDCGVAPCPFGIRAWRTSPDCYPSTVPSNDSREYYPFGKAHAYLLLISFSSIRFYMPYYTTFFDKSQGDFSFFLFLFCRLQKSSFCVIINKVKERNSLRIII